MTGINLNVQNSYAAVFSASQPKSAATNSNLSTASDNVLSASNGTAPGEQVTFSQEALELLKKEPIDSGSQLVTPASNGFGVRPPSP